MDIRRLKLQAQELGALREFYHGRLGLPVADEGEGKLAIRCGKSILEFEEGQAAYYHFAFNIPPLAVAEAAAWLEGLGITLLPFNGDRIVPFPNWDAEAVYFHDPAGNIVELIARWRLLVSSGNKAELEEQRRQYAQQPPRFDAGSWLSISEIGLATHSPVEVREAMTAELGLAEFWCTGPEFCALGDHHGLFIIVDASHKHWIPSNEPAKSFPLEAEVGQGGKAWHVEWRDEICSVSIL